MSGQRVGAIILAAGKGTRLKTELPKVLHEICGRPMLAHVFDACWSAGIEECIAVVGYKHELVRAALDGQAGISWVEQNPQNGTGHAVMVCREQITGRFDHVLVLCGDGPLIRSETVREIIDRHIAEDAVTTLGTALLDDPTGYGRIHRDASGKLLGIVEHGDCTPEQLSIREVNPSMYCFRVPELLDALEQLTPNNVKNEYYITDCIASAIGAGHKVQAITAIPALDIYSINTRKDLAMVNRVMRDRVLEHWMDCGVTIVDPATTWIDARATLGQDTIVHPFVTVTGPARIGCNCHLGPFANVSGTAVIADGTRVAGSAEGAV